MSLTQLGCVPGKAPGGGAAYLREWAETVRAVTVKDVELMLAALELEPSRFFTCVAKSSGSGDPEVPGKLAAVGLALKLATARPQHAKCQHVAAYVLELARWGRRREKAEEEAEGTAEEEEDQEQGGHGSAAALDLKLLPCLHLAFFSG